VLFLNPLQFVYLFCNLSKCKQCSKISYQPLWHHRGETTGSFYNTTRSV
jgi:hypothetical protein